MSTSFQQKPMLLESDFRRKTPAKTADLQYVIKIPDPKTARYEFRLEIFGKLFSLVLAELPNTNPTLKTQAKRVDDSDLRTLLHEQQGAYPVLLWDYGTYHPLAKSQTNNHEAVYQQLLNGQLDFWMHGARTNGSYRLIKEQGDWFLTKLPNEAERLLTEQQRHEGRSILWLRWDGFYADHTNDTPQVITRGQTVLDANLAARARKIEVGMDVAMVRNLAPECVRQPWQESVYTEKSEAWLDVCTEFSGVIEPIDDHIAAVDLTTHPNPSSTALELIAKLAHHSSLPLFPGLGPSKWIAQLASQTSDLCRAIRDPAAFLAPLSVHELVPLDKTTKERFVTLGYTKVKHISQLPVAAVKSQFEEQATLISLAIQGKVADPVQPLYPKDDIQEILNFSDPIADTQMIDACLVTLGTRLAAKLKGRQSSVLAIVVSYESHPSQTIERIFTRPINTASALIASLRATWAQSEVKPEIVGFLVILKQLTHMQTVQRNFFAARTSAEVRHTLSTLNQAVGEDKVILASQVEIPHRSRVLKEWRNSTGWH